MCEREGGRRWLPVANSPYGLYGRNAALKKNTVASDLRRCVKEKVDDVGSPSLIVHPVSADIKQRK